MAAVARSRSLHHPWTQPPSDAEAYAAHVARNAADDSAFRLAWYDGELLGALNLSQIVRGALQGAYLGYYAFAPLAGRGLMRQALGLLLDEAFGALALHRVEANIQPGNTRSIQLVASLGFRREGFSPRYLRIDGAWRDHERWAILAEEHTGVPEGP